MGSAVSAESALSLSSEPPGNDENNNHNYHCNEYTDSDSCLKYASYNITPGNKKGANQE